MKVTLQNYSRGQRISHSELVILKGHLSNDPDEKQDGGGGEMEGATTYEEGATGTLPFEIWHRRQISGENEETEVEVPFISHKGHFSCLLKLGDGVNLIRFCDKDNGPTFDEFQLIYCPEDNENHHFIRILNVISGTTRETDTVEGNFMRKLKLGLTLVQLLFAEKLYENGFERRSFKIFTEKHDRGDNSHIFKISVSPENISQMSTSQLWEYIAKEIRSRENVWDKNCKYVAFVSHLWKAHYEQGHQNNDNEKIALGGGGLALIDTSSIELWPDSVEKILRVLFSLRKLWTSELEQCATRFGAVDKTEGALYAASVGSVAHEIGHIFDLGHTDGGLMGNEFNRLDTSLSPVILYPPVAELFRKKLESDMRMLRPKVGLPNSQCLTEDLLSLGVSCTTLLYFHKWFQPKSVSNVNRKKSNEESIVLLKNKVVSKTSTLVALQVRETEDERLLKSWTFVEKVDRDVSDEVVLSPVAEFTLAKNNIPIPASKGGDSNKALVVAGDSEGNLLKTVVNRDSLSESFTVIRRRT